CFRRVWVVGGLLVLALMIPIQLGTMELFFLALFLIGSATFFGPRGSRVAVYAGIGILIVAILWFSGIVPQQGRP
ncbi:MAG: hypothetical protein KC561_20620, partial [Myxococcales bacterium]|nr:hypothetical protein [Myxococcales bacterium]